MNQRFIGCVIQLSLVFFAGFFSVTASAQELDPEPVGELSISDLFLAPRFSYSEPSRGHFEPGDSYISARWKRDDVLSAQVTLGTQSLINIPNRYTQLNGDAISVVEAYGQADGVFGRVRFGLIPIPFGSEGGVPEGKLRFPRSLIFEKGLIGLRDYGASFTISHDRFYSEWAIHNGEGGRDLDNKVWFTARWGYLVPGKLHIGASGQTGRTGVESTDPGGILVQTPEQIMDVTKGSKWRIGNAFVSYDARNFGFTVEETIGDVMQDVRHRFDSGHADVYVPLNENFATLARYDYFDPKKTALDKTQYVSAGLSYRTAHDVSEIYFLGTQELKPKPVADVHSFMVMWKLTPQIFDRR